MKNEATLNEDKQVVIGDKKELAKPKISLRDHAGSGMEKITAKDMKLPILKILHSSSPVLEEDNPLYNEKAKIGDIYNPVTNSLYGKSITVVPCFYINTYNEWEDRGKGIGRPTIHLKYDMKKNTTRDEDKKDRTKQGTYVEDTGNHFCYIVDPKTFEPIESVLITMKSSQKKKSAAWNTTTTTKTRVDEMGSYIPPLWSNVYKLSTVKEENTKEGYKWHGWAIQFVKWLDEGKDDAILQVYKSFFETVSKSDIFGKVDFESGIEETETKPQEKPKPVQVENQSGDTPF
tara:strand:- start:247 stop:1113 length:867 start_codon:yes stop_codon:yes gene_type:complete